MKIENLTTCTGCSACYSVCGKNAIIMTENDEGFLYPKIEKSKCVECGLCEKVCSAIMPLANNNNFRKTLSGFHKNEDIRLESSSGGIFTAFAEKIIEENGVVFGAKFADDFSVIHSWTETKDGLADFRGSKYLQSVIGNTYKECESFLKQGRTVLFTGTPCQIQGLKKFLRKEYLNLYTIDFFCHGVPNNALWQKYIDYICDKTNNSRQDIVRISFRRKLHGWKNFCLSFSFSDGSEYSEPQLNGAWMLAFNKNKMMRESCYQCPSKGCNIVSDITIGDFWGSQYYLNSSDEKGLSIFLVNTDSGVSMVEAVSDKLALTEIVNYDVLKYK